MQWHDERFRGRLKARLLKEGLGPRPDLHPSPSFLAVLITQQLHLNIFYKDDDLIESNGDLLEEHDDVGSSLDR